MSGSSEPGEYSLVGRVLALAYTKAWLQSPRPRNRGHSGTQDPRTLGVEISSRSFCSLIQPGMEPLSQNPKGRAGEMVWSLKPRLPIITSGEMMESEISKTISSSRS